MKKEFAVAKYKRELYGYRGAVELFENGIRVYRIEMSDLCIIKEDALKEAQKYIDLL